MDQNTKGYLEAITRVTIYRWTHTNLPVDQRYTDESFKRAIRAIATVYKIKNDYAGPPQSHG